MYTSILLPVVALLPCALGQLNTLAKADGLKYFGTATDNSELSDSAYTKILYNNTMWGQITPGNSMKWSYIEPEQNTFTYTQGDQIASIASTNDMLLRCHNLVWYNELPSWVTSGTWTNETLIAALKNHITNEVTHYKGQCYCWDVVNEAFNDNGTYRSDVFYDTIGPEYIPIAYETAMAADPDVKLYYNDYNIEYSGAKATAAQNLVKSLKARGIKIDGVGLQGHFIVGDTPDLADQKSNLASFTALGVEVAYTELDVRFSSLPPSDSGLTQQGTDYVNTVMACVETTDCVGVTVWDFDDEYSWVPSTFSGSGDACLWYANLTEVPAYYSVVTALESATATATATATTAMPTTETTTTTAAATTSTVSTSSGSVPKYGQCGGTGWTGATACVAGTTCTEANSYYSQCL